MALQMPFKKEQKVLETTNASLAKLQICSYKISFSNSGINKVAMVKNALLPMSLYSLICVNEIIRYHLHIVDRSTMCK